MSSHVPIPLTFTLLDSIGDIPFVLVLLEATGAILDYWQEIKTYYLPLLLDALRAGSKNGSVRVCWQLTSDPPGYHWDETQGQVPDFHFAPSTNAPVTVATLRRSLETTKSAPREQGWTRHLIVIGVSPPLPSEVGGNRHEPNMVSETHQAMAAALAEERIRMHMLLSAGQYMQPLRDLHNLLLRYQHSTAVPPWFQYDSTNFTIQLSPQPLLHDSTMEVVTRSSLHPGHSNVSAATTSRSPAMSLSSPVHETPTHSLTPSPPSRRTRLKTKDSSSPPSPSAANSPGGLVSFLQKAHGLSKKRTSSAKVTKRTSVNEPSRPSTSSRPILPKLTLPQQTLITARPIDTMPKIAAHLEVASAVPSPASVSAYIATASGSGSTQMDTTISGGEDRYPPARWPFLKLMPMTAAHEGPGFGEGANAALRSLEALAPRPPAVGLRLTTEHASPPRSSTGMYMSMPPDMDHAPHYAQYDTYETMPPPHSAMPLTYATGSGYPMSSSSPTYSTSMHHPSHIPSGMPHSGFVSTGASPPPQASPTAQTDPYPNPMRPASMSRGSPTSQAGGHLTYPLDPYGYPQQMASMHPYGMSPTTSQSNTPLPSPSVTAPVGHIDEGENQPFIVTPEYEAFANARFEEAIRSGAMQASMTPAALSPNIGSALSSGSSEYFGGQVVPQADHIIAPGSGLQQTANFPQSNYTYPGDQHQHNGQGHPIYQQGPGATMSAPGSAHYYAPPGTPPPGPPWYGP